MTTSVQRRRGTTAQHSTFTGLEGELTIDTSKDTAVIHDGATVGGFPLAKEGLENTNTANLNAITGADTAADDTFLIYDTSASVMKRITRAELNNAIEKEPLSNVTINSGSIDGTTVGSTTASSGKFTTLDSSSTTILNGTTIPASKTLLVSTDIGTSVQGYDADLAAFAAKTAPTGNVVGTTDTQALSNKTVNLSSNTLTGTIAQFNTALSDADFATLAGSEAISNKTITSSSLNSTPIGASSASTGNFTTLGASGVATFSAGTVSAPAITTTGDTNTGIFFPAADTIAFTEGGVESMRIDANGNVGIRTAIPENFSGYGALTLNGSSGGLIAFQTGGTANTARIVKTSTFFSVETIDAVPVSIKTNNVERMIISSAGLVGIGTSSPSFKLHVSGASEMARFGSTSTDGFIRVSETTGDAILGSTNAVPFVGTPSYLPFTIRTSNAERMRIDGDGNVGIGTSSTTHKLDVNGTSMFRETLYTGAAIEVNGFNTGDRNAVIDFHSDDTYTDYSIRIIATAGANGVRLLDARGTGGLLFKNTDAAPMAFHTSNTERMRIDSSGNMLIGTTTATAPFTVNLTGVGGTAAFRHNGANSFGTILTLETTAGTDDPVLSFKNFNGGSPTNYGISCTDNGSLAFLSGASTSAFGNERMRIDSSGNVLVGTTSATARFVVTAATNSSYAGSIRSDIAGDVAQAPLIVTKYDNNSTTSQVFQRFAINAGGTANGQINANGASAVAFGSWSDKRLKENIVDLPSQLNNVLALKPCEFDYKDGSGHQIGFIAQEIKEIYPDVVGEGEDGMLMVTGWSKTEARLVKAIQEQQKLIENLTTRLNALEGK